MPTAAADDPLIQPTRARLFARLVELRRAASTDELATGLGLHVNGVRRHLERLERSGLVDRRRTRHGRGRPRDEWALATGVGAGGSAPRRYGDLARWLARAIPPGGGRLRRVERTGREIGREIAPDPGPNPAQRFHDALAALGFRPVVEQRADGEIRCRLDNCPYLDSVRENADLICSLHRGITAGLIDELAPGARLERWEPHDPERAGCIAEVAGSGWRAGEVEGGRG